MGKTPEQILSDIRGIKAETDPHDITAPRLGGTLEDMLAFSKDTAEKVDRLPAPSEQNYKGKITITDLLALSVDIGDNDLYLVYSSGSDDEGWGEEGSFTLNGIPYADGTFVQWMGGGWMAVNAEDVNIEKVALFNPLSDKMDIIVKTYPQTSYDHLYGRSRYGMMIADVACYELDDETGAYKPKIERMTGQYAGSTNLKTLIVPFARYYYQGGELVYEGGLLNASDYRLLKEGRLFFATYGTTALSQIRSAVQDGKEVLCVYGNIIYRLTMLAGSRAVFFSMNDKIAREAEVDENGWDIEEYELPSGDSEAVKYTAQVLTSARQEQARNNISAASQLLNNLANGAGLNMVLKFTTSDIENLFRLKISKKNGVTVTKDDDTEDCIFDVKFVCREFGGVESADIRCCPLFYSVQRGVLRQWIIQHLYCSYHR